MTDVEAMVRDAMRAAVADVVADDLYPAVRRRRARQAGRRVAAVATMVVLVAVGAVVVTRNGSVRLPPTAPTSAPPTAPTVATSPVAAARRHTLFDVRYVPAGFRYFHGYIEPMPENAGTSERISYSPGGGPRAPLLMVETTTGDGAAVGVESYRGTEKHVELVRIGARSVVRVWRDPQDGGMTFYTWTEEPGLTVYVEGRDGVADAEVRRVIEGLRRREADPTLVLPYPAATADRRTLQWAYAVVVDERTLDLVFTATDGTCRVLSEVEVVQDESQVYVTLREAAPAGTSTPCGPSGVVARARVTLDAPLGTRQVVDAGSGSVRRTVRR